MLNIFNKPITENYGIDFLENLEAFNQAIASYNNAHQYHDNIPREIRTAKEQVKASLATKDINQVGAELHKNLGILQEMDAISRNLEPQIKFQEQWYEYFKNDANWDRLAPIQVEPSNQAPLSDRIIGKLFSWFDREKILVGDLWNAAYHEDIKVHKLKEIKTAWKERADYARHTSSALNWAADLLLELDDYIALALRADKPLRMPVNEFEAYKAQLTAYQQHIAGEKKALAQAMLERLKLAYKANPPGFDDITASIVIALAQADIAVDIPKDTPIRCSLTPVLANHFSFFIQQYGSQDTVKGFSDLIAQGYANNINEGMPKTFIYALANGTESFKAVFPTKLVILISKKLTLSELKKIQIDHNLLNLVKELYNDEQAKLLTPTKLDYLSRHLTAELERVEEELAKGKGWFTRKPITQEFMEEWKKQLLGYQQTLNANQQLIEARKAQQEALLKAAQEEQGKQAHVKQAKANANAFAIPRALFAVAPLTEPARENKPIGEAGAEGQAKQNQVDKAIYVPQALKKHIPAANGLFNFITQTSFRREYFSSDAQQNKLLRLVDLREAVNPKASNLRKWAVLKDKEKLLEEEIKHIENQLQQMGWFDRWFRSGNIAFLRAWRQHLLGVKEKLTSLSKHYAEEANKELEGPIERICRSLQAFIEEQMSESIEGLQEQLETLTAASQQAVEAYTKVIADAKGAELNQKIVTLWNETQTKVEARKAAIKQEIQNKQIQGLCKKLEALIGVKEEATTEELLKQLKALEEAQVSILEEYHTLITYEGLLRDERVRAEWEEIQEKVEKKKAHIKAAIKALEEAKLLVLHGELAVKISLMKPLIKYSLKYVQVYC